MARGAWHEGTVKQALLCLSLGLVSACGNTARCTATSCAPGSVCDPLQFICVEAPRDAGRADAGLVVRDAGVVEDAGMELGDGGQSSVCGSCRLATPICDEVARRCVRCTLATGCFGDAPVCDISFQGGLGKCEACVADGGGCGGATPICDTVGSKCVGCLRHADCASSFCNLATQTCFVTGPDGGIVFDAGTPFDAGSGFDAGVSFPDGGPSCPGPRDGGLMPCTMECPQGFICSGNECVLNGSAADLQVTLRWDSTEDLDLHLDEPMADGGTCELWYGSRNPACALGALDLDSQAGCSMDLVLIENIIYPTDGGRPTPGTYAVRVDHYTNCSPIQWVPFQVEVRKGLTTMGMCGVFRPNDPDWSTGGAAGAGRPMFTFTYP